MNKKELPEIVPIFPIHGTILLPGSILPLHIFERKYLQMVEQVLEEDGMIGMIQPTAQESESLCDIGCVGSIEQSQSLPKGNYLIQLQGQSRFHILEELETETLYRQARVDYSSFRVDQTENNLTSDADILYQNFKVYSEKKDLQIEWDKIESIPAHYLINLLSMNLGFSGIEKQMLLESPDLNSRLDDLISLMHMSTPDDLISEPSLNLLN